MNTIEIPLDPATARGLQRPHGRLGLVALAALQTCLGREEPEHDVVDRPVDPELPVAAQAGAVSSRAKVGPDEIDAVDWPDPKIDPAAPSAAPRSSSTTSFAETHTTRAAIFEPTAASPAAPAMHGGDVYIAHYYARLPGDANRNPYTRLGGPIPYA